jgi:CheY-like chemotaxis protein/anti-sigma regulatory factor (Ser/Thr protein kinase)
MRMVRQVALTREVKTTILLDEKVASVWADVRRLKQILINLLANAVKFTPVGGSVGLEVQGDPDQQRVHFIVWDTGIGIAEADIEQLFQPFVQVDSRLARAYEGTGLGLALVARMTKLLGGGVTVSSTVGQGSRFTISLPWQASGEAIARDGVSPARVMQEAPRGVATAAQWTPSRSALILLAEDNAANSGMVAEYLEIHGYQVVVAYSGAEAVQHAHADRPDVILMDIQMPGMDGLEAMKHIRAQGSATPIIALTALAMPGDQERCLAAGAQAYLTKPVSLQNLREVILSLLAAPDTGGMLSEHQPPQ